jgi:predicted ribosome quality control (RQC) complex YloA/Tae2 family protein
LVNLVSLVVKCLSFMTPVLIQILARELEERLSSCRLSHISQSANDIVELSLYHPDKGTQYLTIALLPLKPILFASLEKHPALAKPPNFCRSLRKQLEYAQLTGIESEPGERLIHFLFKMADGQYRLVFEGIPKYPNLILAGPDNQIISALRYKNEVERPVLPQSPYHPPPQPLEKPSIWKLGETDLKALWEKAGRPPLGPWLKNEFRGVDPELASYLESFGEKAFSEWVHTQREIAGNHLNHFTLFAGPPPSLCLFPHHPSTGKEPKVFEKANPALEALFRLEVHYRDLSAVKSKLESEVKRAIKHEKRILEKLKKDRSEAERSDQYQWWGELIMAQLHKIKLHLKEVTLEDVVRGAPAPVTVPLDPEATPLQNAQRFFKKARKGSRGLAMVENREKEIQARLDHLKSAQRSLPALQDAAEIKKAFQELFPKKKEAPPKPKKAKEEKVPTPNILRTRIGRQFELCVGTSAAANEYVTFQLAQPEDLWFHVRDMPGAHVVLRRLQRDSQLTDDLILLAAKEAASHSKAQPGSKVNVSFTEKKHVKKIPGAPMGMVSMTKEKNLVVEV